MGDNIGDGVCEGGDAMIKRLLVGAVLMALTGCNAIPLKDDPIKQLTLADAQNASALAKAAGDAAGQKCYDYIVGEIQAAGSGGTCGLLCLNETKRSSVTSSANLGQACGGVLPLVVAP